MIVPSDDDSLIVLTIYCNPCKMQIMKYPQSDNRSAGICFYFVLRGYSSSSSSDDSDSFVGPSF